jgi:hypothetical protein
MFAVSVTSYLAATNQRVQASTKTMQDGCSNQVDEVVLLNGYSGGCRKGISDRTVSAAASRCRNFAAIDYGVVFDSGAGHGLAGHD